MNGVADGPSVVQRGGLFGIVAAAHVVLLAILIGAKGTVLRPVELTIVADILPMEVAEGNVPPERSVPSRHAQSSAAVKAVRAWRPAPASASASAPTSASVTKASSPQLDSASDATPDHVAAIASTPSGTGGSTQVVAGGSGAPSGGPATSGDSGGGVSQARFDADYLKNPAPPYPPISRRMREEGKVILRVLVAPEGSADSVEIKSSSGSSRLDESALRTVRTWRFVPAQRGETPVPSWVLVPVIFKLEQ